MAVNEKFVGISKETGEEITGFLIRGTGRLNRGKVFICTKLTMASYEPDKGSVFGFFHEVLPDSVKPVSETTDHRYDELLEACSKAEMTPQDLHELAKLISELDDAESVLEWIERIRWHVKRCDELAKQIEDLKREVTAHRIMMAEQIKKELTDQMRQDLCHFLVLSSGVLTYTTALRAAKEITLRDSVIKVFQNMPIQYTQAIALRNASNNKSKLFDLVCDALNERFPKYVSFNDAQIEHAVLDIITKAKKEENR